MCNLASHGISKGVLHSLWVKRIHISVRCVLFASEGAELTKVVEIAERHLDQSMQSKAMSTDNSRSEPPTLSQQPAVDSSEEGIVNVRKQKLR
jgi:hypothetical protein